MILEGKRPISGNKLRGLECPSEEEVPKVLKETIGVLRKVVNDSLSKNTWRAFEVALSHIAKAEQMTGMKLSFPFIQATTYTYVVYLIKRGLRAATVRKYMPGLRKAHITRGYHP